MIQKVILESKDVGLQFKSQYNFNLIILIHKLKAYKDKCRNKGSWLSREKDAKWRHRRLP